MKLLFLLSVFLTATSGISQAESFRKSKMVDAKGKEQTVMLDFESQDRRLTVKGSKTPLVHVAYAEITKFSYETAVRRRTKEGAIIMAASLGIGAAVMLTKSKNHWLYIDYKQPDGTQKHLTMKLDKSEYENVLKAAKEQVGKDVEMLTPKDKPPK